MDLLAIAETERGALVERYPALRMVRFVVDPRPKLRLGRCRYGPGGAHTVGLSARLQYEPETVVRNTVRHELAHAIVGPGFGHGGIWKMTARAVGAEPKACTADCAKVWKPARVGYVCSRCGAGVFVGPRSRAARILAGGGPDAARVTARCCRAPLTRDPSRDRARGVLGDRE